MLEKCTATYSGECYVKGYGRKLYKKAVKLTDVVNSKGEFEKVVVNRTKALNNETISSGSKIEFTAICSEDGALNRITNIIIL